MKLLLMRHGQTAWNTKGKLQGRVDIPLDEEGMRMAVSCGKGMEEVVIDLCISSPLSRARQTAEPVLSQNREYALRSDSCIGKLREELVRKEKDADPGVRLIDRGTYRYYTDDRLMEADFGPWEGLVCTEVGYQVPLKNFSTYWNDPYSPEIVPGVERLPHVVERVRSFLADLAGIECLRDKTVLLMVHGCIMRSFMCIEGGRGEFKGTVPLNCEVLEAELTEDGNLKELGRKIYHDRSMVHDYYATMKQE